MTSQALRLVALPGAPTLARRAASWREAASALRLRPLERILRRDSPPEPIDDRESFKALESSCPGARGYDWSAQGAWKRGLDRAPHLAGHIERTLGRLDGSLRVLDAACGDGMTGAVLASSGMDVACHDLRDWRDERARPLPFLEGTLSRPLPCPPEQFDFIFSYNAMEHVDDPAAAVEELVRLCRPGGCIYLDFGPLYCSPWGLHAFSTIHVPYAQFLLSERLIDSVLAERGVFDLGEQRGELQPLNRWRPRQFAALWQREDCTVVEQALKRDRSHLSLVRRFPGAFQGRGLTLDDLTIDQVAVLLRKRGGGP